MHELHKSGVADEDLGEGLSSDSFVETLAEKNVIGSVVDLNIDRGTFSAFLRTFFSRSTFALIC